MANSENESPFSKNLRDGQYWEARIAEELLAARGPIWYPQQTEADCEGDYPSNQVDLLTFVDGGWQAIEVKSRSESFLSINPGFPYPDVAVGSVAHWDSIKFPVFAVIVVSQVTGAWEAFNYRKTRTYWQTRQLDDLAYVVPKRLFKPSSLLIHRLNKQVAALPSLYPTTNIHRRGQPQ